jgi:hypothetical protein
MFKFALALGSAFALASAAHALTFDIGPNSDATFDVPNALQEIQFSYVIASGGPGGGNFQVIYQYYLDADHTDSTTGFGDYTATTALQYDAVGNGGYPDPGYDGWLYFTNTTGAVVRITTGEEVVPRDPSAPVPEPASWAMMICGFGMTGGVMRARRKSRIRFA